ncbi:MAG TPA: hypothetical protein VLD57_06845 [Blastocatellia bacterium]|nr:hypothetical protein [Blastocatellia bacterium]
MIKVAMLGLGNVGRAFVDYIRRQRAESGLEVFVCGLADASGALMISEPDDVEKVIAHKSVGRSIRDFAPNESIGGQEFISELPRAGVSALIESLPTSLRDGQPALDLITAALRQGTNVVTVDKGPLVHGYDALRQAMQEGSSRLGFSGTTGVSPPADMATDRVLEIRGVLNGTTNYILTEIQERSISFSEALSNAQSEGIAEPDPSLDVEGWDTANKILILARVLMGADSSIEDVSRIGIGPETESLVETARSRAGMVRLVGRARIWQGRVRVSVAPKIVASDSPFYSVNGTSKAAVFRTEKRGEIISFSTSGRDAISQVILDDLMRVSKRD